MKLIVSIILLLFVITSCGKKSDPEFQGSTYNKVKRIS